MNAGETFHAPLPPNNSPHLFVIISDPQLDDQKVVVVPFMSIDDDNDMQERICTLNPGDHSFVRHPTFVNFDCAKAPTLAKIQTVATGNGQRVSPEVLEKIRVAATISERIPLRYLKILEEQGLV